MNAFVTYFIKRYVYGNITGYLNSSGINQKNDIWVSKYNTYGQLQWNVIYNNPADSDDFGRDMEIDKDNNIYIIGTENRQDLSQNYNVWIGKYKE